MAFQHVAGRNLMSDYADGSIICSASFRQSILKTRTSVISSKAFLPLMRYGLYDVTGGTRFCNTPVVNSWVESPRECSVRWIACFCFSSSIRLLCCCVRSCSNVATLYGMRCGIPLSTTSTYRTKCWNTSAVHRRSIRQMIRYFTKVDVSDDQEYRKWSLYRHSGLGCTLTIRLFSCPNSMISESPRMLGYSSEQATRHRACCSCDPPILLGKQFTAGSALLCM
jgi:hypothetical protein